MEYHYRTHASLTPFFLPGALCFLLDNRTPAKGTAAVQHSIVLEPREEIPFVLNAMRNTAPGKLVMLMYPPKYVNVRLVESNLSDLSSSDSLHPTEKIVPIPQWGNV